MVVQNWQKFKTEKPKYLQDLVEESISDSPITIKHSLTALIGMNELQV